MSEQKRSSSHPLEVRRSYTLGYAKNTYFV